MCSSTFVLFILEMKNNFILGNGIVFLLLWSSFKVINPHRKFPVGTFQIENMMQTVLEERYFTICSIDLQIIWKINLMTNIRKYKVKLHPVVNVWIWMFIIYINNYNKNNNRYCYVGKFFHEISNGFLFSRFGNSIKANKINFSLNFIN